MKHSHSFTFDEIKSAFFAMVSHYQSNAFDHQNLNIKSNYQKLHFQIRNKLEVLNPPISALETNIEIWNEVSGAGKTKAVLDIFDPATDLYIAPTVELMDEFRAKLKNKFPRLRSKIPVKTHEVSLLDDYLINARRVFVDEVFTHAYQYVLSLICINPTAQYILLGDHEQTEYLDEYGHLPANSQLYLHLDKFKKIRYNRYTFRFYKSVCCLLQNVCNYNIWPHPNIRQRKDFYETKITRSTLENRPKADFEICFSNKTVKYLLDMQIASLSAKKSQGKSMPIVNVHFNHLDYDVCGVRSLQIVALSRASHQLNLVVHDPVTADKVIGAFGPIETINDAYNPCIAPENFYVPSTLTLLEDQYEKTIPPVSVKFDHTVLLDLLTISDGIKVRDEEFVLAEPKFNKFTGELERTKADKIQDQPDTYMGYDNSAEAVYVPNQKNRVNRTLRLNKYLEIKEKITRTFSTTQFGKTYHVSNNRQTLQTSVKRAQKKRDLGPISFKRVKGIWKRIQRLFLKDVLTFTDLNNDLAKALTEVYRKRIKKDEMPKNIDGILKAIDLHAREFQKDITKIKGVGASISNKVGQPIKAFSQEVNAAFCTYFRAVEERFVKNLKSNVIYANKYSEEDLNERLNNLTGYSVISGLDCSEYDGSQNKNTIKIEAEIVSQIWDQDSKNLYYQLRQTFKVVNEIFSYFNDGPKPSGGSDTLFGNSLTNFGLIANCVDEITFVATCVKGDDSWVFSRGNPWRKGLITSFVNDYVLMDMKVSTPMIPEFCGSVYVNGVYFYNFPVLAAKILTRNYSDEEDLKAYQTAVCDKLKIYFSKKDLIDSTVGLLLNSDEQTGELLMEQIRAFANIKYSELCRNLIDIEYNNDNLML